MTREAITPVEGAAPGSASPGRAALERRLEEVLARDRRGLRERLRRLRSGNRAARRRLEAAVARSRAARAARAARLPVPEFPPELPITSERAAIAAAVEAHPVVVVRGETGSGKTTQLPKICLASGRGAAGWIGHTQPRRIAARSVAARVARELGARVGEGVGSKVRFHDEVGPNAYLKVMTDGILVAEIASDPLLEAYDTLIIDEAHERSLNIDLLLGHLKSVLPERPDLRVVVSSATLDPKRISDFFDGAPIIEVSGRAYPVEIRYAEADAVPEDPVGAVPEAVRAVAGEGPGDILVFLPGERDIREAARALRGDRGLEVLPLYARLNHAQQERIFRPGGAPSGGPRDQRRGDLHHRARHPVRGRYRTRPHQPLQLPHPGTAPSRRAGLARLRRSARGTVRAGGAGGVRAALLARGLRVPRAVHPPGDPAHEPRLGHPSDGRERARAA